MPRKMRLLADLSPLRESPAYRRLWAGSTLSSVGGALTTFAVPLQVYDITRSPLAVGGIGVATAVPILVIGLLGGSLADAFDRRTIVLTASAGMAVVSAGLAAQAIAGLRLVWLLYALTAVDAALGAIGAPARQTFIPSLLPPSQLAAGLALNRLTFQIMLTAGPALAGVITAAPHLGFPACYLIDAVTFGASMYGVARLPGLPPRGAPPGRARARWPTASASSAAARCWAALSWPTSTRRSSGCRWRCFPRSTPSGSTATPARSACS